MIWIVVCLAAAFVAVRGCGVGASQEVQKAPAAMPLSLSESISVSVPEPTSEVLPETNSVAGVLRQHGWDKYVQQGTGLWVRVDTQELLVVRDRQIVRTYRCSTAARGTGNQRDSEKTPLGWHQIGAKIGDQLPVGAILEERRYKGRVWRPGDRTDADLVLSRVLRLRGLESGYNLGGNVDSWDRCIYIHGTNDVSDLGRPTSHGCVRLSPTDVIELFNSVPTGCRVLITQ